MKFHLPKIYPITDRSLSGLSHSAQVKEFLDAGATLIQVRDKTSDSRNFFEEVRLSVAYARERGCLIIVNDRVDIALLADAKGVHLGHDDLPAAAARKLLGRDRIVGVSTHSLDQVKQALDDGIADYLAFGPIFATATKTDHEPVVGLEMLSTVRHEAADFPVVAIGGIDSSNLVQVFDAGADSAAMISEFYRSGSSIGEKYRSLAAQVVTNNVGTR